MDELNLTGPQLEKVGASLYAYDVMVPAMKASSSLNQDAVSRLDKNMLVAILGIETRYGQDTTNNVKDGPFQV